LLNSLSGYRIAVSLVLFDDILPVDNKGRTGHGMEVSARSKRARCTTMQRRKYLAAIGSLAAGGAAAMGTGAFSGVAAKRTVDINVANDPNALLGFTGANARNSDYLIGTQDGFALEISDDNGNILGEGVNKNALTLLRDLFDIRNQGANPVFVWVEEAPDGFGFFADYPAWSEPVPGQPDLQPGPTGITTGIGEGETGQDALLNDTGDGLLEDFGGSKPASLYLEPGDTLREVGIAIDTSGDFFGSDAPVNGEVTFRAQDIATFEGTVDTSVGGPNEVRVTDPTP
jgi:hypothetical protein